MSIAVICETVVLCALLAVAVSCTASTNYAPAGGGDPVPEGAIPEGAIPVSEPGSYGQAGATYVLTKDISSPRSAIFLGKDVTLDLNGHTITFAEGGYEHVPNYGFEDGLTSWDFSKAPTAKIEDTDKVKPFIGKHILRLSAGEEIVSPYITLPVADRTYYAMCGVVDQRMRVEVGVEDADGKGIELSYTAGRRERSVCPQRARARLGGGFVFSWLFGQPAGKYRIRVKAGTDCLIDQVDIRPAMDVGVGVVDEVLADASYRLIYAGVDQSAFPDYLKPGTTSDPADSIPRAAGEGKVVIRNGVIKCGFRGIRTWGVQSTAAGVKLELDNVRIVNAGINAQAVNGRNAKITNCRFEIDCPFLIHRHRLVDSPVSLVRTDGSEVADCEFIGGQGNLYINGRNALVHDNLFVNAEKVTNHYSVMLGGAEGVKIYRNRFKPREGSGITVFVSRDNEIYENTFEITAADGNCEYANEDYSTNAIRITDYDSRDPRRAASGNRIHNNKFHITGKYYGTYEDNVPIATAMFVSVGGGDNFVHDNEVVVDHQDIDSPALACAFYIGGSSAGGQYWNNRIITNVPAFWIATPYGNASNVLVKDNTIVAADDAPADFRPIRLGFRRFVARNVTFEGNKFVGCEFAIDATDADHTYTRK